MTQSKEYYCTSCGGTDVSLEGYCYWDSVEQKFVHYETSDEGQDYCTDCEDHIIGDFRSITDVKTLAQIAIKKEEANDSRLPKL